MNDNSHAADQREMGKLHNDVAKKLRDLIENGETERRAGKDVKIPVTAAMLGAPLEEQFPDSEFFLLTRS